MNDDISNEIYNELDDIIKCYLLKLSIFYEKNIDIDMRKLHRMTDSINKYLIECVENSTRWGDDVRCMETSSIRLITHIMVNSQ